MNILRAKLNSGKKCFGTHVSLADHQLCELMGMAGFDFVWIDSEHAPNDYQVLEVHIMAAKAGGTASVVRIPWNVPYLAKKVLDMGPDGIIFPMINNAEEAKQAIESCMYPPLGNRGFGPVRANAYGFEEMEEYLEKSKEICRFLQIETKQAIENLESFASVPYIDGLIIGPCDLSGSCGLLNRIMDGEVDELINIAVKKAHSIGLPIGISYGSEQPEVLKHWFDKGFEFVSAGGDLASLVSGARMLLSNMKNAAGEE